MSESTADHPVPPASSIADPGPLGLAGFAMTTMALSLWNANIYPAAVNAALALALASLAGQSAADCLSYGYDFVDGGGPYCMNTTSTAYFTFGTEFFGAFPDR